MLSFLSNSVQWITNLFSDSTPISSTISPSLFSSGFLEHDDAIREMEQRMERNMRMMEQRAAQLFDASSRRTSEIFNHLTRDHLVMDLASSLSPPTLFTLRPLISRRTSPGTSGPRRTASSSRAPVRRPRTSISRDTDHRFERDLAIALSRSTEETTSPSSSAPSAPPLCKNQKMLDDIGVKADDIPPEFFCKISEQVMDDPVFDPKRPDELYDRAHISHWVHEKHTNPVTRAKLEVADLKSNTQLKENIEAFIKERKEEKPSPCHP